MNKKKKEVRNLIKKEGRIKIAFLDYPDVFEDFYPHYGVDQKTFATTWHNTGNHAWLKIVQKEIGDIIWYALSLKPELKEAKHEYVGCRIKFIRSSWFHRKIWKLYYLYPISWKWRQRFYSLYATLASYTAVMSFPLFSALRKDKPDLIFVQEYCSGRYDMMIFYAWLFNIPLITLHAGSVPEKYLGKFIRRFTISRADWIFSSGESELNRLKNSYKISESRLSIIRPPIDVTVYKPIAKETICNLFNLDTSRRYFIFIGRLDDKIKRVSSIINAIEKINSEYYDIDLLIIGTGKDENKLKQQALKQIPGRIHFKGWITEDEEKARLINISECLIMASKSEGFPTVIGEAFACGVPVISSNVGTISDLVIEGKTGWLFSPGDEVGLLKYMKWVAGHPDEIKSMKTFIRNFAVEKVSFEAITKTFKQSFSSLLQTIE